MADPSVSSIGDYGTTLTVDAPDVVAANDLVIILFRAGTNATTPASTGFTWKPVLTSASNPWFGFLWKRSSGSEPTTYSVTASPNQGTPRGGNAFAVSGAIQTGDPFRDIAGAESTTSVSSTPSVEIVSGLLAGDLVLWAATQNVGTLAIAAAPTGFTRLTPTGSRLVHVAYQTLAAGGGTGSVSALYTGSSTSWSGAILGAIIPDTSSHIPVDAQFSGSGSLTATATEHYSAAATFSGSGTLTATTAFRLEVFAAFTGTGTLTATAKARYSVAVAFAGSGALTATANQHYATTVDFTGSGALTATAIQHFGVAAALSGSGTLTAVARLASVQAQFSGTGTLTATTRQRLSATAAFAGIGTLTAVTASRLRLATTGTRISDALDLSDIIDVTTSSVNWTVDLPAGTTMTVETSVDGGSSWQAVTNGGTIPGITTGLDCTGIFVQSRVTLSGDGFATPLLHSLSLTVTQAKVSHFENSGVPDGNRFNLGVYLLTTPDRPVGETPTTYQVQGYDKLYLLTHEIGDTYTVGTGTGFLTAVRQAITDAGVTGLPPLIDSTLQGKALQAPMVWHGTVTPTSWLRVINDLLSAIGYRGLWVDADGRFRSEPYQRPQDRAPEWVFDMTDEHTDIVTEDRTYKQDAFEQLNWWLFIRDASPTTPVEGDGLYTIDRTNGEPRRPKITKLTAADQASLESQGNQIFTEDTQRTAAWDIKTGPIPVLGHFDIATVIDPELGTFKTQSSGHSIPLDGSDVTLTLEVVS